MVTIIYNGTTAAVSNGVSGVEVSSNGAHVVVNSTVSGVEYVLSGTTTNGSFKVYSEKKFKLSLAGVSILNPVGAAINIQSSKRVFVVCADETTNVLTDGSSYTATTDGEDMKACLFSEGQLISVEAVHSQLPEIINMPSQAMIMCVSVAGVILR